MNFLKEMTKMLRKIIAIVLVSFFVMTGLSVLNQGNQNYNIAGNNINSFTLTSNNTFNFSINKTIVYSKGISSGGQTFGCYDNSLYYINGSAIYQFNVLNQKTTKAILTTIKPNVANNPSISDS